MWCLIVCGGVLVSGGSDGHINAWDIPSGHHKATLTGHTDGVCCLTQVGPHHVASGSGDHTVRVWDIKTFHCERTISNACGRTVCGRVWRPKGRGWCVVVTDDATDTCQYLRVLEVSTGRHIQTIQQHKAHKDNMCTVSDVCGSTAYWWVSKERNVTAPHPPS